MTPFGIKLRRLRRQYGMTMTDMARELNVSAAYLSQLEHGKRGQPSSVMIDRICAIFGLIWDDAEKLKALAEVSRPRVVINTEALGPEAMRAANLFARLLPRIDKEEIKSMAEWLEHRNKQL